MRPESTRPPQPGWARCPANSGGRTRPCHARPIACPPGRIVTGFGERLDDGRRSAALIIAPAPGALSARRAAGEIVFAGPLKGYGRVVIIEHGGGWTSVIAGLADTALRA